MFDYILVAIVFFIVAFYSLCVALKEAGIKRYKMLALAISVTITVINIVGLILRLYKIFFR